MKTQAKRFMVVGLVSLTFGSAFLVAQVGDDVATESATQSTTRRVPPIRIPFPYQRMESITQEQKEQIAAIRRETAEQIEVLRNLEREKIMALLTPEQRAEAEKMVAQAQEREARDRAERESRATTRKANSN